MVYSKKENLLNQIENKFKKIAGLDLDISSFPLNNNSNSQVETDKNKSKQFSEVFTPLWLVDEMIQQVDFKDCNSKTLDLCAGFGQFSIRLMRYYFNTFEKFSLSRFIKDNHYFAELQLSSCYKLISIFNVNLNLFIGDAGKLNRLPKTAKGIWIYLEVVDSWVCLTKTITNILCPNGVKKPRISEEQFVSKVERLIQHLNEEYNSMAIKLEQMMRDKKSRLVLFSELNAATADTSHQDRDTPEVIVRDMIDRVDDLEHKTILVLYNCEIIEYLIHGKKLDPKSITYAADSGSDLEAKFVKEVYGVDYTLFDKDLVFFRTQFKGKKFDVAFSNPPYKDGVDLKILENLLSSNNVNSIAKEYVIVHPSTWMIDLKGKTFQYLNLKRRINGHLKCVKFFNSKPVFGVRLSVPGMITHIDFNKKHPDITVDFLKDNFIVDNIHDITKFGKEWNYIVKYFFNMIKTYTSDNNVWQHNVKHIDDSKMYCQLSAIMGDESNDPEKIYKDNIYTCVLKNSDIHKGVRKREKNSIPNLIPTFEFNSIIERDNFIEYLKTDFVRFCLCLFKSGKNLHRGEMGMIPWMDFTQSWDDEKLFNYFDVNKETQDYIKSFLPDYYSIRK
jgi:hypothetical protein